MSLLSPWSSSVWLLSGWLSLGRGWGGQSFRRHLSTLVVFHFRCWLRVDNYFIWSFIGPVSFVIVVSGTPSTGLLSSRLVLTLIFATCQLFKNGIGVKICQNQTGQGMAQW